MVEQVLRIVLELAFRLHIEAASERNSRAFVQIPHGGSVLRRPPPRFVRRELRTPAERVPKPGVIRPGAHRVLQMRDPFRESAPSRHQRHREKLPRLRVVRISSHSFPGGGDAARNITGGLARPGVGEALARLVAQRNASTSATASVSVKTRKEFVRTFPWLLTARDTRVIVSSSGASATIT